MAQKCDQNQVESRIPRLSSEDNRQREDGVTALLTELGRLQITGLKKEETIKLCLSKRTGSAEIKKEGADEITEVLGAGKEQTRGHRGPQPPWLLEKVYQRPSSISKLFNCRNFSMPLVSNA